MWKSEEEKLKKSGRKWAESDYLPCILAELFCKKCGKSLGKFDITTTNLQTNMYCSDCVAPFVKTVPYNLDTDKEVIADCGTSVQIKYIGGYYKEIVVDKICYFNKKGRYVKIKGKTYYLNIN